MKTICESLPGSPEARKLAELQAQMLRPGQSANRDGGFELGWGVALLLFGLGPYFNAVLPTSLLISAWTSWLAFLPLFCAAFAPFAIPKLLHRLITWPRSGYVANRNEMKLGYLVQIMIFGGALGNTISLPVVLMSEIHQMVSHTGPLGGIREIVLKSIKLLVCAGLTAYLGPKVIKKFKPRVPTAYDAAVITESLKQTVSGRTRLRLVKFTLLGIFIGLPVIISGIAFGLMYWTKSVVHPREIDWSELGMPGLLIGPNALLYVMGSGVVLKPNRWKWFVLPFMVAVPILAAPLIPYPAVKAGLTTIFDPMPPVMLCLGTVWFLSGTVTLILFILHNPIPSAEPA